VACAGTSTRRCTEGTRTAHPRAKLQISFAQPGSAAVLSAGLRRFETMARVVWLIRGAARGRVTFDGPHTHPHPHTPPRALGREVFVAIRADFQVKLVWFVVLYPFLRLSQLAQGTSEVIFCCQILLQYRRIGDCLPSRIPAWTDRYNARFCRSFERQHLDVDFLQIFFFTLQRNQT